MRPWVECAVVGRRVLASSGLIQRCCWSLQDGEQCWGSWWLSLAHSELGEC